MRSIRHLCFFVSLILTAARCFSQAGGVASSEPRFKVVRSVSGSHGSVQNGRYIVADPRTVFYFPADRQIVVYFEWEGPLGQHHFEGYWRNPEGKAVVISDFSYEAKQSRFGGYWTLDLTDGTKPGMWSLEARVDGEVTGTHSLQIIASDQPAPTAAGPRLLESSEIYKRALSATVTIDNIDAKGERFSSGSGFFVADGVLLTAFQVIDGAAKLRVILPDGRRLEAQELIGANRLQDWALVKVNAAGLTTLPRARANSWAVGDRCFSLETPAEGSRTLVDGGITGTSTLTYVGDRVSVSFFVSPAGAGAPVLNEYGDVIGVYGGSIFPGTASRTGYHVNVNTLRQGSMATPITSVPAVPANPPVKTLAELAQMGLFVPHLVQQSEMISGMLTAPTDLRKDGPPPVMTSKTEFSPRDRKGTVVLSWSPRMKAKVVVAVTVFDINNHPIMKSPPGEMKLHAGEYLNSSWNLDLGQLPVGMYRLDVMQGPDPIWRTYFRVVE